jgi:hypothetical protein
MKKIRIMMTAAAFAVAVAGAVTSNALTPPPGVYAYTPEGYCIQGDMSLPGGCNSSSGNQVCTAYFEDYGNLNIYSTRWSEGECVFPYLRW